MLQTLKTGANSCLMALKIYRRLEKYVCKLENNSILQPAIYFAALWKQKPSDKTVSRNEKRCKSSHEISLFYV